jgi:hypothetical protein
MRGIFFQIGRVLVKSGQVFIVDRAGRVALAVWSPEVVGELLIRAFGVLPDRVVEANRGDLSIAGASGSVAAILAWPQLFLSINPGHAGPDETLCVMAWARARAISGHSIAEFCRSHNLSRKTFDLRRRKALVKIAAALNGAEATI